MHLTRLTGLMALALATACGGGNDSDGKEGKLELLVPDASNVAFSEHLASNPSGVFWVDDVSDQNLLQAYWKASGEHDPLLPIPKLSTIAADDSHLYFGDSDYETPSGMIRRVSMSDRSVETFVAEPDDTKSITLNATHIFWATSYPVAVKRMPKAGGTPEELVSPGAFDFPNVLAADDELLVFSGKEFNSKLESSLWSVPVDGGEPKLLISQFAVGQATFHGDFIYVIQDLGGIAGVEGVHRVPRAGGSPESLTSGGTRSFVIDSGWIYHSPAFDMRRQPLDGGAAEKVVSFRVSIMVADASHIYFFGNEQGFSGADELFRLAK